MLKTHRRGAEFATPDYTFEDIDYFKLVIFKKQKAPYEPLTFPHLPKGVQIKKNDTLKGRELRAQPDSVHGGGSQGWGPARLFV